jgi:hypothetical protein
MAFRADRPPAARAKGIRADYDDLRAATPRARLSYQTLRIVTRMPAGESVEPVTRCGHDRLAKADPAVVTGDARMHQDTEPARFQPAHRLP